ncbi:MAG: signal peptidase I [Clostridia bacterium]|nr:signal peptidase I [Clostridia bacterium]
MADVNNDMNTNEENINENSTPEAIEEELEKVKAEETKAKSIGREIFEWVYSIVIAIAIAMLIKGFLFDIVKVDGQSMENTLFHNNRLIVTKLGYEPHQGDIVILDSNYTRRMDYFDMLAAREGKDELSFFEKLSASFSLPQSCKKIYYVKRVIATEGQTVDIRDGVVYVDDKALDEPYAKGTTYPTDLSVEYPLTVNEGYVFVMGDNREHSSDSRVSSLGQVNEKALLGKSQIRVFPFNQIGLTR